MRERVLVAEDDPLILELLTVYLQNGGFAVEAMSDGISALAREGDRPAALVTDLMMPGVDGVELIERLRARPDWKELPAVVVTAADPDDGRVRLAMTLPRVEVLFKPPQWKEIATRLRTLIDGS